jgi:tetratricopeptide (TPR) repeat protein
MRYNSGKLGLRDISPALEEIRRTMRTLPYTPALPAALLIVLWPLLGVPARSEEPASVSEADLTYFYKAPNPARVARLITHFDALRDAEKVSVRPPLMGFLAAAFQRYPADIDKMIPESVSPQMLGLIAVSLRLAGQQERAESLVEKLKSWNAVTPDLANIPTSLGAVEPVGPKEFDLLWGASFATGDPRYCSKILTRFAATANAGDNADDLVHLVRNFESGSDQHWIVEKRGNDRARELMVVSTALWALHSNAQQHLFVQAMVNEYVTAYPSEPAAKALLALTHEYGYYQLGKLVSVGSDPAKHSVSINIAPLSQILDDLGRHAGSYPPHFEFADDRQRAEKDLRAISDLLDPLTDNFSKNPPMLLRLAILHAIGVNLDVPDSYPKAVAAFDKLLDLIPNDPQANYRYGSFLAATTKDGRAIPYLEKARSLDVEGADYWLGFSYAVAGNKTKAIESLERYTKRVPTDEKAIAILDAIRNDRFHSKVEKQ